jgi:hypothetical protein
MMKAGARDGSVRPVYEGEFGRSWPTWRAVDGVLNCLASLSAVEGDSMDKTSLRSVADDCLRLEDGLGEGKVCRYEVRQTVERQQLYSMLITNHLLNQFKFSQSHEIR